MKKILLTLLLIFSFQSSSLGNAIWDKYNLKNVKTKQRAMGRITEINGDVQIKKIGRDEIEDARVGDLIHRGDIITQFAGNATVRLNSGASAKLQGEAQVFVDNDGFHLEHGNANFSTRGRTDRFNAGHSTIVSRNSQANISKGKNGFINKYFADPDTVAVERGSVSVRVPRGVEKFDIFYGENEREISADRFILKADEMAIFDGPNVKIVKKDSIKKPLERDDQIRFYGGGELSGAFISRSRENADVSSESKLVLRPGVNFTIMRRRVDPMYSFSFTTDPEMEEFKFEYINPNAEKYAEGPFNSTSYYKVSFALGNTHGSGSTPTHGAIGLGYGWLKKVNDFFFLDSFLLFTDFNLKQRNWNFDRDGEARKQHWSESELSIESKIMYRLR